MNRLVARRPRAPPQRQHPPLQPPPLQHRRHRHRHRRGIITNISTTNPRVHITVISNLLALV